MLFRVSIWSEKEMKCLCFTRRIWHVPCLIIRRATPKIVDTSAIIDGRILDIIRCGFIDGDILIPQGVINELQVIADKDSVKREKVKED